MYIMIDNFDSFVYNLVCYFEEAGGQVETIRNDQVDLELLEKRLAGGDLEGLIISPGPGHPDEVSICYDLICRFGQRIPIFGVCLGHQMIARTFGGKVAKGPRPMHGKVTGISHNRKGLFAGLPASYQVTRYHSLVVEEKTLPKELAVSAKSEDGIIMGLAHRQWPVYGVQFHPEAVLTEYGHDMVKNFMKICREFRTKDLEEEAS